MWAVLGTIEFTLPTYMDAMQTDEGFNYAEHALINGKPRLQWVGDNLDQHRLEMSFNRAFCDPETEIDKLRAAAQAHLAMPLVFGNGRHLGTFVITSISSELKQTDPEGTIVQMTATVNLKEFIGDPNAPAPTANNAGLASGVAPVAQTTKPPVPGDARNPDDVTVQKIVRQ
jgi:phage protein U